MTNNAPGTATLSDLVAEEIRALLARRRTSGRKLAEQLGVSPSWVSYRLTGAQPIDLNDLARISAALDVDVTDLLPPARNREGRLITTASPQAERAHTSNDRSSRATGRPRLGGRPTPAAPDLSTVRVGRLRDLTRPS